MTKDRQEFSIDARARAETRTFVVDDGTTARTYRLPGAPVLVVTTRYLAGGRTAAVSVATYRADTCRLTFGDTGDVEISHQTDERKAS